MTQLGTVMKEKKTMYGSLDKGDRSTIYERLSRSSWTNARELAPIVWFIWKFTSIYFDITLNGIQNFIAKYQHLSTLQATDICHVQRCAAPQNFNWHRQVSFLKIRILRRYALAMSLDPLAIYLIRPLHWTRMDKNTEFWLIPILIHPSP